MVTKEQKAVDDPRQAWMTPDWLLDALKTGGWAGPYNTDAFANPDGQNAVTVRRNGWWYREGIGRLYHSSENPINWLRASGHIFANPPFALWGSVVEAAVNAVEKNPGIRSVTLVGLDDSSTAAGRLLARLSASNEVGMVHALRVPIPGRWGFDPPPEVEKSQASRAHGVWVLRRVFQRGDR